MEQFVKIDGARALIRTGSGSYREANLHHRGGSLYVEFGKGYLRIYPGFDSAWLTSNPKVKVVDYTKDVTGLIFEKGYPRYEVSE